MTTPAQPPPQREAGSGLWARLKVRREAFVLDVELDVPAGRVLALLGPNGAGKTTALRALDGLAPIDAGWITLDGATLADTAAHIHTPAEARPVGVVFQDYLLFPHLSALDNVAFGPRCQGRGRAQARALAAGWLDRVGLGDRAHARPRNLSGGQAQRVALARALACEPRLLLLDEPLAALDAATRIDIRAQLRRHLADYAGATVLVTHDPLDAMMLADTLAILEAGRIVQTGSPAEIARRPRSDYVARLVGLNLFRGTAHDHTVILPGGFALTIAEPLTGPVFLAIEPAAIALYRTRPDGTPRNLWQAPIRSLEPHGHHLRVHLDGPLPAHADITPAAAADLALTPGQDVWAAVKATETHAYPA